MVVNQSRAIASRVAESQVEVFMKKPVMGTVPRPSVVSLSRCPHGAWRAGGAGPGFPGESGFDSLRSSSRSLSASTLSMSSGSSLGSLASSRGSLNTSSRGSLNSLSSSELYYTSPGDQLDADYQYKLDFLLQEKGGYVPSGPITTIHENEVVKSPGQSGPSGAAATGPAPPPTEAPKSVTSLSSRSSLSSLSPPGSPLVLEGTFPMSSHDVPLHRFTADFDDCDVSSHFADMGLGDSQTLLDADAGGAPPALSEDKDLREGAREPFYEGAAGTRGLRRPGPRGAVLRGKMGGFLFPLKPVVRVPLFPLLFLFRFVSGVLGDTPRHFSPSNKHRRPWW